MISDEFDTYEVWSIDTGNLIGVWDDRDEALSVYKGSVEDSPAFQFMLLGIRDEQEVVLMEN